MLWHFAAFSQGIAFHHWVFFFFQSFHCAASHYSHSLLLSLVDAFLFCVACTYYKYLTRTSGRAQSVLITHTLARKGSLSIEFRFLFCLRGVVAVGVISCFVNGGLFFFWDLWHIYKLERTSWSVHMPTGISCSSLRVGKCDNDF